MFVFHRIQSLLDPVFWCSAVFTVFFALSTIVYHDLFRQPLLCVGVLFFFVNVYFILGCLSPPASRVYTVSGATKYGKVD